MLTDAEIVAINKVPKKPGLTTTERTYRAGYAAGAAAQREADAKICEEFRLRDPMPQTKGSQIRAWAADECAALIRNAAPTRGEG